MLKTSYCQPVEHLGLRVSLTVFETLMTCILISVRLVNTRDKYLQLSVYRNTIEHVHDEELDTHPEGNTLRLCVNTCYISGIFIIALNLICLIVFHMTSNHSWTIVTNNLSMFYILIITYILLNHINALKYQISVDHHKIALYEALLLLGEFYWAQTDQQVDRVRQEMELFTHTVKATKQFSRPNYITCPEQCKWDVITGMESGV